MLLKHKRLGLLTVDGQVHRGPSSAVGKVADAEFEKVGCLTFLAPPLSFACAFSASLRRVVS